MNRVSFLLSVFLFFSSQISANEKPFRVVSMAPHITEIIFKIGAGDLLVGRTNFCHYPPKSKSVESVGGYLNIDYEKLVRLEPDLIFQFPNSENRKKMEDLGLKVVDVPNETIIEILSGILIVGKALGYEINANRVIEEIEDSLNMYIGLSKELKRKPTALFIVGRERGSLRGLNAAGKSTYLSEIWEKCGGLNAFGEVKSRYFTLNKEDLLKRPIDVILEFHPAWNLEPNEIVMEKDLWDFFSDLEAYRKARIYIFNEDYFVIPGPRITQIATQFSKIIKEFSAD
jgi:iron complex transport system substrate-binding protein